MRWLAVRLIALGGFALATLPAALAHAGSIHGTVIYVGTPPIAAAVDRHADPKCPQGGDDDSVVVTHGKLRDVLVRIKNGTMGTHAPPATPVVLVQQGCAYLPRVAGIVAGQKLVVKNADRTFHDVWGTLAGHELWNRPQQAGGADLALDPTHARPGDVVELKCAVHPWMHAYVVVQDHPYFAVTDDQGRFELDGLLPGSYDLEAWHPVLGTRTLHVVIGKGKKGDVTARITYQAE